MSFKNIEIVKKANIYFNGNVTSRTIIFPNEEKKTLGIMMPGEYEFGTEAAEDMEIISGKLTVKLPQNEEWIDIVAPSFFQVPANSKFQLKVSEITDYCCSYLS